MTPAEGILPRRWYQYYERAPGDLAQPVEAKGQEDALWLTLSDRSTRWGTPAVGTFPWTDPSSWQVPRTGQEPGDPASPSAHSLILPHQPEAAAATMKWGPTEWGELSPPEKFGDCG